MKYNIYLIRKESNNIVLNKAVKNNITLTKSISPDNYYYNEDTQKILLKEYFIAKGYSVSWSPQDAQAVRINDIRFDIYEYNIERSPDEHFIIGLKDIEAIENVLQNTNTSEIRNNKSGFVNVRDYAKSKGFSVCDCLSINPNILYVNGFGFHKGSFETYEGDCFSELNPTAELYAPEVYLDEIFTKVESLDPIDLLQLTDTDKISEINRIDNLINSTHNNKIYCASKEALNQKILQIQGWINGGDTSLQDYYVEEISDS